MIGVGKDSSNSKSMENVPGKPKEKKAQSSVRRGESGPMSTIKAQEGLEEPDKVTFGGIESDLDVVEPDDSRPRRMDQKSPPKDLKEDRQVTTQDYEEESYVGRPPEEPRPGPLHPVRSKKDSEKET